MRRALASYMVAVAVIVPLVLHAGASGNYAEIRELIERGKDAEAEIAARAALQRLESASREDTLEKAEVLDLLAAAMSKLGKNEDPETIGHARRALAIKERYLEPGDPSLAETLAQIGVLEFLAGRYAQAGDTLDRGLQIAEKELGDHLVTARLLRYRAMARWELLEYEAALADVERARSMLEATVGTEHRDLGTTLDFHAGLLMQVGRLEQARPLFDRALSVTEAAIGADHPTFANTLANIAHLESTLGNRATAMALNRRAIAIWEKALGPEHPSVAMGLGRIGLDLADAGDLEGAEQTLMRAIGILERSVGPDHPHLALALNNLGSVRLTAGNYPGAREAVEASLAIRRKILPPAHPALGYTLTNLGGLYSEMGAHAEAVEILKEAVAIIGDSPGDDPALITVYSSLGSVLSREGRTGEAMKAIREGINLATSLHGPEHFEVAWLETQLAGILVSLGNVSAAEPLLTQAIATFEQQLGPDHLEVAHALYGLVLLRFRKNQLAESLPLVERTIRIYEGWLGPDHPRLAGSFYGLARIQLLLGEHANALDSALRADRIMQRKTREVARSVAEREALRYRTIQLMSRDVLLTILDVTESRTDPLNIRRAWDAIARSRALVLDELASRHRAIVRSEDPLLIPLVNRVRRTRNRLARAVVQGPGPDGAESFTEDLQALRIDKESAERALAAESLAFDVSLARSSAGLLEVEEALPSGSSLVAYVKYNRVGREKKRVDVPSYLAFVRPANSEETVLISLGPAAEIDARIRRWSEAVAIDPRAQPALADRHLEAGRALSEVIWDPIAPHTADSSVVFVVPAGELHAVSLAALPSTEDRYLVESAPPIHYLSTERDLVRRTEDRPGGSRLIAVGAPAFDAVSTAGSQVYRSPPARCAEYASLHFLPLPGSLAEVTDIAAIWIESGRDETAAQATVRMLTGAEATEAAFKSLAASATALHLATHGFAVNRRCDVELDTDRSADFSPDAVSPAHDLDNPLLLTGLALAGANRRNEAPPGKGIEDGVLTAAEIASLDLTGAEWVVLSACGTGTGQVLDGEGVLGLRRAFEIAGARTLIMTLWHVEDDATRIWMGELYAARRDKRSAAEAVRTASLVWLAGQRTRGRTTHPFYWGAFVAAGDWR